MAVPVGTPAIASVAGPLEVGESRHMGAPNGRIGQTPFWEILGLMEKIGSAGKNWLDWKNLENRLSRPRAAGRIMNKSIIICKQIIFGILHKKIPLKL